MKINEINLIGSNDSSVEQLSEDLFDVSQYVNGLSDFIKHCVTPMTISIQGDWGSGKTSMMNMIRKRLEGDVITIWFNTWQYSQFNMGEDLSISFLGKLIQSLQPENAKKAINETFKKAYTAIKKAGLITVDHFVGGAAAAELEQLADKFAKGEDDAVEAINNLKQAFKDAVSKKLEEKGKDRLVVFIDDLDRLNPGKAVELLEVLKVFLDCDNCVFILAIDYSVVSQGVKEKYGDLIGEDKGKSFFDKIIQVPFKMPVAHYKVDNFLIKMFKQVGIDLETDNRADVYVNLIQNSVGCNPRTMKRLFNAYLLLTYISRNVQISQYLDDPKDGAWYKEMLFGILCCQHAFEELYNFLIQNYEDLSGSDLLKAMCYVDSYKKKNIGSEEDDEKTQYEILIESFRDKSDEEIRKMAHFMELFIKVIDKDGNGILEETEIERFGELLNLTTITSAGNNEVEAQKYSEKEWRVQTRKIMTIVADEMKQVFAQNPKNIYEHPVYQIREGSPDFGYAWADVWAYVEIEGKGQVTFENVLMVDEEGNLGLKTYLKRRKSFPKQEYKDYFQNHQRMKDAGFVWQESPEGLVKIDEKIGVITEDSEKQQKLASEIKGWIEERYEML